MKDATKSLQLKFLGSFFDGLGIPFLFDRKHKAHLEISDADVMLVLTSPFFPAVTSRREQAALFVDGHNCHPGYVKLKFQGEQHWLSVPGILVRDQNGDVCLSNRIMQNCVQNPMPGLEKLKILWKMLNVSFNGPAVSYKLPIFSGVKRNIVLTGDLVGSFAWNEFPHEAHEWLSRKRSSGWPSTEQVRTVKEFGCHLVPVANPGDRDSPTEWRISFVLGERHLALSLNQGQRRVYRIIKLIHKQRLGDLGVLSTYHLKTTLFWLCERIPQERWTEQEMGQRFYDFLDLLIDFLSKKCIPNYFIRENNMIDYMIEQLVNENVEILCEIRKNPKAILDEIKATYDLRFDLVEYLLSKTPFRDVLEELETQQVRAGSPEDKGAGDLLKVMREILIDSSENDSDSVLGAVGGAVDAFSRKDPDSPFKLMKEVGKGLLKIALKDKVEAKAKRTTHSACNDKHGTAARGKVDSPQTTNIAENTIQRKHVIVTDSIGQYLDGNRMGRSYVKVLREKTITDAHDYIIKSNLGNPESLTFIVGTISIDHQSVADTVEELHQLRQTAETKYPDCEMYFTGILNRQHNQSFNERAQRYNDLVQAELGGQQKVHFIAVNEVINSPDYYREDGFHLSRRGTSLLAQCLMDARTTAQPPSSTDRP
ncbi:uncharacterized protein LOC112042725 [Lingula anatina]|uniref:Uncharacterized protein LOC112042725 n=1 Tax=Lingula anatina TaxID=7574 RepID=A0A2R2MTE1_LINAN|nr:uncharacterized protein LOC112042725 [Lingula anatina]|eukprot:XP_023933535.1 uncharacterized protein LOC112042725 [Lingula anatina]